MTLREALSQIPDPRAQDPGGPGRMKAMTLTLPPQVEEAARRVQALLEEAKARGLILEYSLDDFSGEPLPGVGAWPSTPRARLRKPLTPSGRPSGRLRTP
jgi:hypothetical protein